MKNLQRLFNNAETRSLIYQALALAFVAGFFYVIVNNALSNLETRGISTGFGFLSEPAGFGIIQSLIEYSEQHSYGRTFIVGLLNTLLVAVLGIVLSTFLGFSIGIARLSRNWLVSKLALWYIEIFRNVPLLLQILFWYGCVLQLLPSPRQSLSLGESLFLNIRGLYMPEPISEASAIWIGLFIASCLLGVILARLYAVKTRREQTITGLYHPTWPVVIAIVLAIPTAAYFLIHLITGAPLFQLDYPVLKGFNFRGGMVVIPELIALVFALSIYTAAFIAENVRSGLQAVNKGQTEAALALGMPQGRITRLIIIPQAMRVIIPPTTSQYLNLAKNSSLATAIGYPDLVNVFMGTTLNQTGQAIEIVAITMAVYLTISLSVSALMNLYNRKTALVER